MEIDSLEAETYNARADNQIWHRGLVYTGNEALIQLGRNPPYKLCEACVAGKASSFPFSKSKRPTTAIGEISHV